LRLFRSVNLQTGAFARDELITNSQIMILKYLRFNLNYTSTFKEVSFDGMIQTITEFKTGVRRQNQINLQNTKFPFIRSMIFLQMCVRMLLAHLFCQNDTQNPLAQALTSRAR